MYRPGKEMKERIILLPDDTRHRVAMERHNYQREANMLTLSSLMDPDHQSFLIENLRLLNLHERCAQSLMHEYGHVLHWREFDWMGYSQLNFQEIYSWFVETGYFFNVDKRYPDFAQLQAEEKLHRLKESLVEDYRISLNMADKRIILKMSD